VLTVTQPADGIYLLLRQLREGSPLAKETLNLLQWNGGGANSSGRGIANIDTQGVVHPDQFWQSVTLGNVKNNLFSDLWDAKAGPRRRCCLSCAGPTIPWNGKKKLKAAAAAVCTLPCAAVASARAPHLPTGTGTGPIPAAT
jgi:hypothetical protein